tara:strand:+ start:520 stop:1983 length:1464 start_codon:yes stop_codon:yes gene_type:complete
MSSLLLSALSGVLLGLAFSVGGLSFLVWFSLFGFFIVIKRAGIKDGLLSAFIFSLCYHGIAMYWLNHVTTLGFIALLLYLSLYSLLFFLSAKYFFKRPFKIITIPCLWITFEFLRENIWPYCGWTSLGYTQASNTYFIQIADIAGVKLLSFIIVLVNVYFLELISFLKQRKILKVAPLSILKKSLSVVLILSLSAVYSVYRLKALKPSSSVKVSIVQPATPEESKYNYTLSPGIIKSLFYLGKRTKEDTLTIFPEAAWPYLVNQDNISDLKDFAKSIKRDSLIGVVKSEKNKFYNAALFIDKNGNFIKAYRKIKLVPYGEYIPLRKFLGFISVINQIGDMSPGKQGEKFNYKDKVFSVLICFEDAFSELVREFAKGSDFLVNITNDAWFYGDPQSWQHLNIMTLRAIENRISIVRSANTGISGWVSFKGQKHLLTRDKRFVFFPAQDYFTVSLNNERSIYNKFGEWFIFLSGLILIAVCIGSRQKEG